MSGLVVTRLPWAKRLVVNTLWHSPFPYLLHRWQVTDEHSNEWHSAFTRRNCERWKREAEGA